MARLKETHFFDQERGFDWRNPDYSRLHDQYSENPAVIRGEATPITLYWTPAHYRVLGYNPDMRFILLFRDPVERAYSHWQMTRSRGLEPLSFSDAIRIGRLRVLNDPEQTGLNRLHSYVERGFYGRQLSSLTSLFPRKNMLFLTQKALAKRPKATLARVMDFLGLDPLGPIEPIRANQTRPSDDGAMTRGDEALLRDLYRDDLVTLERLTDIRL
jgi:hypothetical protein